MASSDRAQSPHLGDGTAREAADFIAASTSELAQLAKQYRHQTLQFLLEMAMIEAREAAKRSLRKS